MSESEITIQRKLDAICNDFEEGWSAGRRPDFEDFLNRIDHQHHDRLLRMLLEVDVELKTQHGQEFAADDYVELGELAVAHVSSLLEDPATTLPPDTVDPHLTTTVAPSQNHPTAHSPGRPLHLGGYEIISEIARGGMGVVYRARDTKLNRIVALKMIRSAQLASAEERMRFQLEAKAAAKLDHPGITPIYETGEIDGQPFFAMKLVEGGSLADKLDEYKNPQKAARLVADIADAIHHAHQRGTLHRDLKPQNILLDDNGKQMVTDFGLAKLADHDSGVTRTGAIMGTPGYMPPEQAVSGKSVTAAADIYSLGAILFALLTGRPPFQGSSAMETVMQVVHEEAPKPSSINSSVPLDLELIAMKCLDRIPEKRYASADELKRDLENWIIGEPVSVRSPTMASLVSRWMKQNIRLVGIPLLIGSLVPLLLLAFLAFVLSMTSQGIYKVVFVAGILALLSTAGALSVSLLRPKTAAETVGIGVLTGFPASALFFITVNAALSIAIGHATIGPNVDILVTPTDSKESLARIDSLIRHRYPTQTSDPVEDAASGNTDKNRNAKTREYLKSRIKNEMADGILFAFPMAGGASIVVFVPVILSAIFYRRLQLAFDSRLTRIGYCFQFAILTLLATFFLICPLGMVIVRLVPELWVPRPTVLPFLVAFLASLIGCFIVWRFNSLAIRIVALAFAIAASLYAVEHFVQDFSALRTSTVELLQQGDFATAARQCIEIHELDSSDFFFAAYSVSLSERSSDDKLKDELRKRVTDLLDEKYLLLKPFDAPYMLETLQFSRKGLVDEELEQRLTEFVQKFSSEEIHGTNIHFVRGLSAYRSGEFKEALEQVNKIAIDNGFHAYDDQKSYAVKGLAANALEDRDAAIAYYREFLRHLEYCRKDVLIRDTFWWHHFSIMEALGEEFEKNLNPDSKESTTIASMLANADFAEVAKHYISLSRMSDPGRHSTFGVSLARRAADEDLIARSQRQFIKHLRTYSEPSKPLYHELETLLTYQNDFRDEKELTKKLSDAVRKSTDELKAGDYPVFVLGLLAYREGDYAKAMDLMNRISIDNAWQEAEDTKCFAIKAMAARELGRGDDAAEYLRQTKEQLEFLNRSVLKSTPNAPQAWHNLNIMEALYQEASDKLGD